MLIEKLRKHLEQTPLDELRQEWNQVMDYAKVGPPAILLIKGWHKLYPDIPKISLTQSRVGQKEIKKETPKYSEFFFNIVLWKTKQPKPHLV